GGRGRTPGDARNEDTRGRRHPHPPADPGPAGRDWPPRTGRRRGGPSSGDRIVLRRAVARALAAEGVVAAPRAWAEMVRALVDEHGGLGPLEDLLRDAAVTDVVVN